MTFSTGAHCVAVALTSVFSVGTTTPEEGGAPVDERGLEKEHRYWLVVRFSPAGEPAAHPAARTGKLEKRGRLIPDAIVVVARAEPISQMAPAV